MDFSILFHVFCCCLHQKVSEAEFTSTTHSHLLYSSAQPQNSYKIGIPQKVVLSIKCLCVFFWKSLPSLPGSETGTNSRWKGEYGEMNRRLRHFSAWSKTLIDFCQNILYPTIAWCLVPYCYSTSTVAILCQEQEKRSSQSFCQRLYVRPSKVHGLSYP